jgi:hypothetical protein
MILSDGLLGQMMEPVEFKEPVSDEEIKKLGDAALLWCIHENEEGGGSSSQ